MVVAPPQTKEKKKETRKAATWVGQSVKRREDPRLLTGRGTFVDDITVPNMHYAAILRSPRAHARVVSIDPSKALDLPGVITVLTGEEVGEKSLPFPVGVTAAFKYYSAAVDKVRYVGEPVAVVVASDRYVAEDALELIEVEYDPLPPVVKPEDALDPDAATLHEELGNNIGCHRLLDYGEVDKAFEEADLILKERFVFPRYSSLPLETYAVIADHDAVTGVITVHSNFMGPFSMHAVTARALNIDENKLRFIVPSDIGGSFGIKSSIYPYIVLISLAAMKAGSAARYGHQKNGDNKVAAEGVEALKEVSGSVDQVLTQLIGGIQSGMGYLGAANLSELREQARYIRISPAGQREAGAHDVVEMKAGGS